MTDLKLLPSLDIILPSASASLLAEPKQSKNLHFQSTTSKNTSIWHHGIVENDIIEHDIVRLTNSYLLDDISQISFGSFETSTIQNGINHISLKNMESIEKSMAEIDVNQFNSTHVASPQIARDKTRSFDGTLVESSTNHQSIIENNIFRNKHQICTTKLCIGEVDFSQIISTNRNSEHSSIAKINVIKNHLSDTSTRQIGSPQVGTGQINLIKSSTSQTNIDQVSPAKVNLFQNNSREISFSSSISPKQFFSIHNSTPEIINELNNSATNIWSNLLQPSTQLDIDFQITDLSTGQLAEAIITGFNDNGQPNAGTISIDRDANGVGWFIDRTVY